MIQGGLLFEILKYATVNKLKLQANFKVPKQNIGDVTKFYTSQGYDNIRLDDTEYFVNIEDWTLIFDSKYERTENYSYKLYSELTDLEKQSITVWCNDKLTDKVHFHPCSYEKRYDNTDSRYIIGTNGELYGWIVGEVSKGVLNVDCVYVVPAYRHLGVWINLLQYISSSFYLERANKEVYRVNFVVSGDNNIMSKFVKVLLKEINHIEINHYIITLIN